MNGQFTIWVMKEYGIKNSWHKEVVITEEVLNRGRQWKYYYTLSLIEGLKDGTIFLVSRSLWAFNPTRDTIEEIDMFEYSESGLAYRPSFLKLQDFESERVHIHLGCATLVKAKGDVVEISSSLGLNPSPGAMEIHLASSISCLEHQSYLNSLLFRKWRNLVLDSSLVNLNLCRSPTSLIVHQNDRCQGSIDTGILKWVEIEDKNDYHHLHHDPPMSLDFNTVPIFENTMISQMGSVNGLICLRQTSRRLANTYICNPVTREIIIIPQYYDRDVTVNAYGFGVGSLTREHKVVRTFKRKLPLDGKKSYRISVLEAEVYTLGTGQWRRLGGVPYWLDGSKFGVVLNDHLRNVSIIPINPYPPCEAIEVTDSHRHSLAVLKSCLCICDAEDFKFTIWLMKEYGIKKSWHKKVVITEAISRGVEWLQTISLIECLKDGTTLFVSGDLWAFYPTSATVEEIKRFDWSESGFTYRPSFLSLQNFESERGFKF
ncbi:hypothetical protein OSB04_015872 [Centaurea solstitialis]|uniref:F-box associated beta-propeller type 3 domain-containing protein n=1 Tax=Centaurea solstitialis TaxID=347529 RepID=A0AA38W7X3_9ASTR|nr:hypothetical protein OSB04_015872 [Centaurea solstitialis]